MKYISTRNCNEKFNFEHVFMKGLSEEGGLFIPESIVKVDLNELSKMTFNRLAFTIFRCYVDVEEINDNDLQDIIMRSFWNTPIFLQEFKSFSVLELFHGQTFSFKDVALQIVGNLFEYFCVKRNVSINILGATSGDTGSAAIYGVKGKRNINCFILYPKNKVSEIQRRQMTTITEDNIYGIEVDGNFDDCQKIVKEIFLDKEFNSTYNLASVNSINWARIMAQMIYYFYAYFQINRFGNFNEKINFVVPTGNFGNVLAGFYAKRMGLPINTLLVATNSNDILYKVIKTGIYKIEDFKETLSPAMDITVSSNFERLLFYLIYDSENNIEIACEKVNNYMNLLKTEGSFSLDKGYFDKLKKDFYSEKVTDKEIVKTIRVIYKDLRYIIDPHTAVGINAYLKSSLLHNNRTICISTAHPGKFYETMNRTLGITTNIIPNKLKELFEKEERFTSLSNNCVYVKEYIKTKNNEKEV